jgi:ferredoxin
MTMEKNGKGRTHVVRVRGTDTEFVCGEDEFVLNAMLHAGRGPIRHGCGGGGCGVCRMKVEEGAIYAAKRMSREHVSQADEREGIVLICCVQPRGDLVLTQARSPE